MANERNGIPSLVTQRLQISEVSLVGYFEFSHSNLSQFESGEKDLSYQNSTRSSQILGADSVREI